MAEGSREGVGDGKGIHINIFVPNNCFNRPVVTLKQLGGGGEQIVNIKKE